MENTMKKQKQLIFSKDDLLMALIQSMTDSYAKSTLVQNIINQKMDRLDYEINSKKNKLENEFGSLESLDEKMKSFNSKRYKKCGNDIKKLTNLYKQKNVLVNLYNELLETSFSNYEFKNFDKIIQRLFKWDKPKYTDKRERY